MNWKNLLNNNRRRGTERAMASDARNDFESDFGRILFSPAMRRMHDKTQVFPLTTDDHIHSRLTHSMEVMGIGHSLGIRVSDSSKFQKKIIKRDKADLYREIPVLLKNACLVHDIGNPPFGHFGEKIIQNYFDDFFKTKFGKRLDLTDLEREDFILFDGNAQGLRVITKLQVLNDQYGLNLTYATLGAFLKYPNSGAIKPNYIGTKKRGVFQTEKAVLNEVVDACGLLIRGNIIRHPLCYLMEAADSICYLTMDIEDGFNRGLYNFEFIASKLKIIKGVEEAIQNIKKKNNNYGNEVTNMVALRIYLIQRLVTLAQDNFIDNLEKIMLGQYEHELIDDDPSGLTKLLKKFSFDYIFPHRDIVSLELTGHSVLKGLLDYYIEFLFNDDKHYRKRAGRLISDSILRTAFIECKLPENSNVDELSDYFKLRVIVDFVSGMTDQFALNHYQKPSGQKIS